MIRLDDLHPCPDCGGPIHLAGADDRPDPEAGKPVYWYACAAWCGWELVDVTWHSTWAEATKRDHRIAVLWAEIERLRALVGR